MQPFEDNKKEEVLRIKQALEGPDSRLSDLLAEQHPSEIVLLLESLGDEARLRILEVLPSKVSGQVLAEMGLDLHPARLLLALTEDKREDILQNLNHDVAADILSQLSEGELKKALDHFSPEDALAVGVLLSYPKNTAGRLMHTHVLKVQEHMGKTKALEEIVRQSEYIEEFYTINVVDEKGHLTGIVSLKNIMKSHQRTVIHELVNRDFVYVTANTDQEEVAKLIAQYHLTSIPVVDHQMHLLGCVTVDDVIDILEEESTEDILKFSGVSEAELLAGNWVEAVKSRLPWLILNLGTAFLAASVIRHYEATIAKFVILAGYSTIIAGMGGNAATQALAVTVRRVSLTDLTDRQAYLTVLKEFTVGLINGACNGFIVLAIALFYDQSPMLGLVVFIAMTGNLIIAGLSGSAIPLLLKRFGIDPAVASSIIITTFTDIFGFLLLLGLATKLLL